MTVEVNSGGGMETEKTILTIGVGNGGKHRQRSKPYKAEKVDEGKRGN